MNTHINAFTKKPYQGRNLADLDEAKQKENYTSNEWVTFLQAKQMGMKLTNAKGKGVHLLRFNTKEEEENEGKRYINSFVVFNTDLLQKHDK